MSLIDRFRKREEYQVEYSSPSPLSGYRVYTTPSEYAATLGPFSRRLVIRGYRSIKAPIFHEKVFVGSDLMKFVFENILDVPIYDGTVEEPRYLVSKAWELSKYKFRTVGEI